MDIRIVKRIVKRLFFAQTLYDTHTQNSMFFRALTRRYIREMHEWSTYLLCVRLTLYIQTSRLLPV